MRLLSALLFLFVSVMQGATRYSCTSGPSSSTGTWATTNGGACGASVPGDGDQVVITNNTTVTVDVNTTWGQSAAMSGTVNSGNTAIMIGDEGGATPATSTAKLAIASGVTLHVRGNVTVLGCTGAHTVGYFAITVAADGVFEFDASAASSPASQKYAVIAAAANNVANLDVSLKTTGTVGHPATFTSNAGGGNGYFGGEAAYNGFYHDLVYADFIRFGDATHNSLLVKEYVVDSGWREPATLDHVRFTDSGRVFITAGNALDSILITHNQCNTPAQGYCYYSDSGTTPTGGATRTFTSNSVFGGDMFGDAVVGGNFTITGWTIDKNYFFKFINFANDGAGSKWLSFEKNVFFNDVASASAGTHSFGTVSGCYYAQYFEAANMHGWLPDYTHDSGDSITGCVFDSVVYSNPVNYTDPGNLIIGSGSGGSTYTVSGNIVLPGADATHVSAGSLLTAEAGTVYTVTNNTVYALDQNQPNGVLDTELSVDTGNVPIFKGNIAYTFDSSKKSALIRVDPVTSGCVTDVVTPAGILYNAAFQTNLTEPSHPCANNQGNSYIGKFSSTPPATGANVTSDPVFVDDNRGIVQSGIGFFGEAACSAWVTSTTYTYTAPGAICVSTSDPNYFRGATINWVLIATNTSSLTNKPGARDGTWRSFWEPSGMYKFRTALYAGTTYAVPGCPSCDVSSAFLQWIRNGMAPTNASYVNASAPSGYIGAVLPVITVSGSQSIQMNPAAHSQSTPISGSATLWAALGSFELVAHLWNIVPQATNVGVFELDSDMRIWIDSLNNLNFQNPTQSVGLQIPMGSATFIRCRVMRDTALARYSLEVWNEVTGTYQSATAPDPTPLTTYNRTGYRFSLGSFYEANGINAAIGMLRIKNSASALGSTIPDRYLTAGYYNLLDFEFEGDLTDHGLYDLGSTLSFYTGSVSYVNTTTLAPVVQAQAVPTVRAAHSAALSVSGFANNDDPSFSCENSQVSGPAAARFSNRGACSTSVIPPVNGNYGLVTRVVDASGASAAASYSLGAVATDAKGGVVIADSDIARLIGPLASEGQTGWSWFDYIFRYVADHQIDMQTQFAPGGRGYWQDLWSVASSHGTVTVINGETNVSNQGFVHGSGTQFQTDFCGGPGNTVPLSTSARIVVWYPSIEYPGTYGRGFLTIVACTSQTEIVTNFQWTRGTGTTTYSGLSYNVDPTDVTGWWGNFNTPGNYYDNVLALYALYYRTGLTRYRDAARTLAHNFWYGPFYDRGKNFDGSTSGGFYYFAGLDSSRGLSLVGLILWALDTGENIWPGMHFIWSQQVYYYNAGQSASWLIQIGDVRSAVYTTAAYALCSQYDTDPTWRSNCRTYLKTTLNSGWAPLQVAGGGNWRNTVVIRNLGDTGGGKYVAATNGSKSVTLVGDTWASSDFTNPFYTTPLPLTGGTNATVALLTAPVALSTLGDPGTTMHVNIAGASGGWAAINGGQVATIVDATHFSIPINSTAFGAFPANVTYYFDQHRSIWFYNNPSAPGLPGNSTTSVGDADYYYVTSVTSPTTAVLNRPYVGTTSHHGAITADFTGFGTQPFMLGLAGGAFGTYIRDSLLASGDTTEAAMVAAWPAQISTWLNTVAKQPVQTIGGGSEFLNCVADPLDAICYAANNATLVAEAINAWNAAYTLTPNAALLAQGDAFFARLFSKPGYSSAVPGFGSDYWWDIDPIGGYMTGNDPQSNKWLGYCFGYGKCYSWPLVRQGGLSPADPLTLSTAGFMPAGSTEIRITVQAPDGTISTAACAGTAGTAQSCSWTGDRRLGNHLLTVAYRNGGGTTIRVGQPQVITVN